MPCGAALDLPHSTYAQLLQKSSFFFFQFRIVVGFTIYDWTMDTLSAHRPIEKPNRLMFLAGICAVSLLLIYLFADYFFFFCAARKFFMPIITSDKYIKCKCLCSVEWLENLSTVVVAPSLSLSLFLAAARRQLIYRSLSCTIRVRRVNRGRTKKNRVQ